jgi:DNA-binding transcriptional MerR regulator
MADTSPAGAGPRPVKSAAAFRTISEVAAELDVPQHVLRFWESKFPQVKPLKRGGGRRYYRPDDVVLLRRIRQCLYQEGYTIKGVQRLLREGALKIAVPIVEEAARALAPANDLAPVPPAPAPADRKQALLEIREELAELTAMLRQAGGAKRGR